MPETKDTFKSRIFHDLDFDKPGKQIGYLRVPQSRDGGKGPAELHKLAIAASQARRQTLKLKNK